jgi:hypothetical protein
LFCKLLRFQLSWLSGKLLCFPRHSSVISFKFRSRHCLLSNSDWRTNSVSLDRSVIPLSHIVQLDSWYESGRQQSAPISYPFDVVRHCRYFWKYSSSVWNQEWIYSANCKSCEVLPVMLAREVLSFHEDNCLHGPLVTSPYKFDLVFQNTIRSWADSSSDLQQLR